MTDSIIICSQHHTKLDVCCAGWKHGLERCAHDCTDCMIRVIQVVGTYWFIRFLCQVESLIALTTHFPEQLKLICGCSYQLKLLREQSKSECERKACDNEHVLMLGFLHLPTSFLISTLMFCCLQPWARSNFVFMSLMSSFESSSSAGPMQERHPFWRESVRQQRVWRYTGLKMILMKRLVWIVSLQAVLSLLLN